MNLLMNNRNLPPPHVIFQYPYQLPILRASSTSPLISSPEPVRLPSIKKFDQFKKRSNTYLKINKEQEKFFLTLCLNEHLKLISNSKLYSLKLNEILQKFLIEYPEFNKISNPLKRQLVTKLNNSIKKGQEIDELMKLPESNFANYEYSRFSGIDLIYHSIYIDNEKRIQNNTIDNSTNFNPPIFNDFNDPNSSIKRFKIDLAVKFKQLLKKGYTIEEAALETIITEFGFTKEWIESYKNGDLE